MKGKITFLSVFFLSNLLISCTVNNYQGVQTLVTEQNNPSMSNATLKDNIISNFNKFTSKSSKKLKAYSLAQANYDLAEEVIAGKDHKNEVISALKSINTKEAEIKEIMKSYETQLIDQIVYLNKSGSKNVEKELINFMDKKEKHMNWIAQKTFEPFDFRTNHLEVMVTQYGALLREVVEENLLDKIESLENKFSFDFFERTNKFFIALTDFDNEIISYVGKAVLMMKDEITKIKDEVAALKHAISAEVLTKLHRFETDYFTIEKTILFLKDEKFEKKFNADFLEINTKLLSLKEFLVKKNQTVIDDINKNIDTLKANLVKNQDKITEPGVWEKIVTDYKQFLEFKKEVKVISEDTKKLGAGDYQKIQKNIEILTTQFNQVEYRGITQAKKNKDGWELYLSGPDTIKMSTYGGAVGISIPIIGLMKQGYGGVKYIRKHFGKVSEEVAVESSISLWKKYRMGPIFGGGIVALIILLDIIPMGIVGVAIAGQSVGIKFQISKVSLMGLTLGAAISLAKTREFQEKKYLALS